MNEIYKSLENMNIGENILIMDNITKVYPNGFVANQNVNFVLKKGEIHGLVGENGAGKSTLMKVLFGIESVEEGCIKLANQIVKITNPLNALEQGIGMVHQHFMLVESMSVAENMVLGHEPTKGLRFDMSKAAQSVSEVSEKFGLKVDPYAKVEKLSVGYKQRIEILKMLLHGAQILLLDEPTAVLTPQETKELFEQLKELKKSGYSIVFISHKLNEVKNICDRITVLRRGRSIVTEKTDRLSEQDISNMMVGRDIDLNITKKVAEPKEVVLKVRNLNYVNDLGQLQLNNVSFDVRAGEILGVAAIEGNGQTELSEVLCGINKPTSGNVYIKNQLINKRSIKQIRDLGVSIVHEDRMSVSSSIQQSVEENIISYCYNKPEFSKNGIIDNKKTAEISNALIKEFTIKTDNKNAAVRTLSGGNIQKVVAAREFTSKPTLLIASQPTRGIDVGAADLIRRKIISLRDALNTGVLLFSADLTELINSSDSIIVLYEGEIVAYIKELNGVTEIELGQYMLGIKKQTSNEIEEVIYEEE